MEDRIEKIITNIEQSFNNLNTSVEQLQKAEIVATSSVATTSKLITEFKSSIESIEKLIKVDFAYEYNKLADLNNNLLEKINKIDFDNKFQSVENKIVDKNFDTKFNELNTAVANINFDSKFQSVEKRIVDKNFDNKFSELNTAVANINFDSKFQSVEKRIVDKNFDNKFSEVTKAISNKNFNLNFQSIEEKIRDKNFDKKFQSIEQKIIDKNFDSKFQSIQDKFDTQSKENKQLKKLIYIAFALIIVCAIVTIFLPKII
jgi:hypothetical protein